MSWSPFDQRRTALIYDPADPGIVPAQQIVLRPVYYNFFTDLWGLASFGPGDGIIISATPTYMSQGSTNGLFYAWNVNTNDDPYTVGGFYHGSASGTEYYNPLVFTHRAQLDGLMLAGADPNNPVVAWVQVIKGQV